MTSNSTSNINNGSSNYGGYDDVSKKKSKSIESSERTALACLNMFLAELHTENPIAHPNSTLHTLLPEELRNFRPTFGRFPHFLLKKRKLKQGTAMSYISQAKKQIGDICSTSDIMNEQWYKNLRHQTGKLFNEHHRETNTKKSNPAPPMNSEDLAHLCSLFSAQ